MRVVCGECCRSGVGVRGSKTSISPSSTSIDAGVAERGGHCAGVEVAEGVVAEAGVDVADGVVLAGGVDVAGGVSPVPSAMTKVAATPAANSPCDHAKTRMMIAPEHGRMPTDTMADQARSRLDRPWGAGAMP